MDDMLKIAENVENEIRKSLKDLDISHTDGLLLILGALTSALSFIDENGFHNIFSERMEKEFPGTNMGIMLHQYISSKLSEKYPEYMKKPE